MTGHLAVRAVKLAGWRMHCPTCRASIPAESEEHAEWLADEHYRDTDCTCWDSLSMEFSPEPCPTCQRTAS